MALLRSLQLHDWKDRKKKSLLYFPNMGTFPQLQPIFILIHWMDDWRLINTKHSRDPRRTSYKSASKNRSCKVLRVDCQDFHLLQRYQSLELQTVPKQTSTIQTAAASLHTLPTVHQINTGEKKLENHNKTLQHKIILCLTGAESVSQTERIQEL